jgi:dTDP-4-dehydrorhamnose 3,5-epimerase
MIIQDTKFDIVKLIIPKVYHDDRGYFLESYNSTIRDAIGVEFVQDNHSKSKKNVLRGLHYQWEAPMGKLVRVVKGKGLDVVVDIRKDSLTYGQWEGFMLSENNFNIVWVPAGFAHGFLSLEEDTHLVYKTSALHNGVAEEAIHPLCDVLNIDWTISNSDIVLSQKDKQAQSFNNYKINPKF